MTAPVPTASHPHIVFVVAVAENGVIGRDNAMPWHLKSDLKRFKAITLNRPVIMGRKTFASIGRPLPGRTNIVVTRDKSFQASGVVVANSLDAAHDIARGDALRRFVTEIMVIGGAEIFKQWLKKADRLEITEVHARPEGDTLLQPFEPVEWEQVARTSHAKSDGDTADFSYVTYKRRG
ncbi:dihydrofolate reductase [Afipia massiliensis]|uniref:Dihydrofolate reductase n=1 Tax=Afipia massiliensis TaxID=211460 RepID=A0A4U6BPA9_9BRAD|nr:dihydrofolate reductase [Afipia massiliensis]TKT72246.1 dihydrofolate reductase [Afipia massiliensis]